MPEIKQTILSNVRRAVTNEQQTPTERRQEQLLTSVNSNIKKVVKFERKRDRMGRFVKREDNRRFKSIRDILTRIKKNTKPDGKGMGILKFMLFMFAGVLIKTAKQIWSAVKAFGIGIKNLGKTLKNWAKSLFASFKTSRFGRWLRGVHIRFLRFFKNMRRAWKSGKGIIGDIGKIFRGIGAFFKRGIKTLGTIKSFLIGLKDVKILGSIIKVIGKIGSLIARFNPISMAVMGWFNGLQKLFTGVMKIISSIGKGFKAIITFFKPALHISKLIGTFLSGFGKIGGMLAKVGGVIGRALKILPIIGQVIMVVMTVVDGIMGFFRAGKYFDKAEGEAISIGERISAVIGSIFSGLTFGLLGDGKKWANRIFDAGKWIADKFIDTWSFVKSAVGVVVSIGKWVATKFVDTWNWIKNAFSSVGEMIGNVIDNITSSMGSVTDILMGLGSLLIGSVKMFIDIVYIKPFNFLMDSIKSLWNMGAQFTEWIGGFVSSVWTSVTEVFSNIGTISENLLVAIGGWGKKIISFVWEGIKNIFSSDEEKGDSTLITSATDALVGLKDKVIGGVKTFIMSIVDGIGGMLGVLKAGAGKVVTYIKDLFSNDEDTKTKKAEAKTPVAKVKEIKNVEDAGGVVVTETSTEEEKTKMMMDFLLNQFADTMAKKIGAVQNKKGVDSVNVPVVKII